MPKKIVEREIIDEDSELSGSEHSITNTEPTPPPINKKPNKKEKSNKKEKVGTEKIKEVLKELDKEESNINKTELNKKLRTVNATNARIENKREKDIQAEVDRRLQKQKEKEEEKQKLKESFENEVEAVINKMISRNTQQEEQPEKPKRRLEPKTPKPKPAPKQEYQEQEEEINPYRLYKNLFM